MPRFPATPRLPAAFEPERAHRMLTEIGALAPALIHDAGFRALLQFAAGNSPYLARLMLKEHAFLSELLTLSAQSCLGALETEALACAHEKDAADAMRRLRAAKRRAALAIALADIAGIFPLEQVTAALTRFADACVTGALRFLLAAAARAEGNTGATPESLEESTGF